MTQRANARCAALFAVLALAPCAAPAGAQMPRAERPTYHIGDKWIRNDGAYELARIDKAVYVFTAGPGKEIHLTEDLGIAKVVLDGRVEFDIEPAVEPSWPLEIGTWGLKHVVWRAPLPRPALAALGSGGSVRSRWSVENYEDVRITAGTFGAFRIAHIIELGSTEMGRFSVWYAPGLQRYVKAQGTLNGLNFELSAVGTPAAPPAVRTPPAITLLEPKSGAVHRGDQATLKVEVKSEGRVRSLVVRGRGGDQTLTPPQGVKAGEVWAVEVMVPLAEGANVVRLEAVDEHGSRAAETVTLTRQSLIAVEFQGPAGTTLQVEQDRHTLDAQGTLTLQLPPGTYQIEATKDGFLPLRQALRLTPRQGKATQRLALVQTVPPAIALLDPKPGAPLRTLDAKLRIEMKSRYRLNALRVGKEGESAQQAFAPGATAKAGEPWVVEALVLLSEGANRIRLEAVDEHGTRAEQTVTLTRQSLVALELRGPPGAEVRLNGTRHTLDAQGTLTLQLPPGSYQIDASKERFTASRESVTLAPGQAPTQKRLALAPLPPPPPPAPVIAAPPADTEAPKIAINYPGPDTKVEREQLVVLGLVTDNVGVDRVQVTVNGVEVAQPRDIGVSGKGLPIRVPAALQPGENVIEITATDKAGNVAQVVRTVTHVASATATAPAPPAPKVANRWAVVIGIGEYEHKAIPRLRFAARDAQAMYDFLTTKGGYPKQNVLLLTDTTAEKPTLQNIRRALGDFLFRRPGRDDMVLIYYAGHGAPEVDAAGAETDGLSKYLIPRNADPDSLYSTAFPMDEIQKIFARIPSERVVMLLDTCYSGTAGGRTFARQQIRSGNLSDQFLERLTRSRGRVVITASGPNEVALESPDLGHGIFTYYLLEGLAGKADRNGDGLVTVSELYEYVEDQVDRAARLAGGKQRPLMKGEIEGTLPLSRTAR